MKKTRHPLSSLSRRSLLGAGAGTFALSLLGCGGDIIAGLGSGGTGSYSSGVIRGFGSILIGDIHYDESAAEVFDDAGLAAAPAHLRLGMVVDVNGGPVTSGASGRRRAAAHVIAMRTEIEGPVASVDPTNGTLTVLDQEVRLTRATVLDGAPDGGLTALRGRVVTVSGFLQASGHYIATRVEVRDDQPERYTLRGICSEVDAAARTLRMGRALISWTDADLPAQALANGQYLRVELDTDAQASGAWRALRISITRPMGAATPGDGAEVELEGCVSSVSRAEQTFVLLGITVDYSRARFEDGSAGNLAPGVKVEVEGRMSADGQVLIADEVELDDADDDEFEIEGRISSV